MKNKNTTEGDRKFVERESAISRLLALCGMLMIALTVAPVIYPPIYICLGAIITIIGICQYCCRWRTLIRIKKELTD